MMHSESDININTVTLQQDSELNTTLDLALHIDHLIKDLSANLNIRSHKLETNVQKELSRLLNILRRIKRLVSSSKFQKKKHLQSEVETLTNLIVVAFDALHENHNLDLATRIRLDAERAIRKIELPLIGHVLNAIDSFLDNTSTGVKILAGLILALPVSVITPAIIFGSLVFLSDIITIDNDINDLEEPTGLISTDESVRNNETPVIYKLDFIEGTVLITLSFIMGSNGAIISILTRVSEYNTPQYEDKYSVSFLPVFMGIFKPIIGGAFGILVFAIMNTTWLNILNDIKRADHKWFTVASITFIAGFSERLAKDLIAKVEQSVTNNQSSVVTVQGKGASDQKEALEQDKSSDQE